MLNPALQRRAAALAAPLVGPGRARSRGRLPGPAHPRAAGGGRDEPAGEEERAWTGGAGSPRSPPSLQVGGVGLTVRPPFLPPFPSPDP